MYGKGICRVTVKVAEGKTRKFWADKIAFSDKVTVYEELTNEGESKGSADPKIDRRVYCVAARQDIIRERPAHMNLKYGTLEVYK